MPALSPRAVEAGRHSLALAIVLMACPIAHHLGETMRYFPPDSVLYLTLARQLAHLGGLAVLGWGHVDNAMVPPPLYPALTALAAACVQPLHAAAERVAQLSMLLALVPLYFLALRGMSAIAAMAVCVWIGANHEIITTAYSPLTEATFILTVSLTLFFQQRAAASTRPRAWLAVGVGAGACFLARQIGVVVIVFVLLWSLAAVRWRRGDGRAEGLRRLAALVVGAVVVLGPYSLALFAQTGHGPFSQSFRRGNYVVESRDPGLAKLRALEARAASYEELYVLRRQLRALLPDGSEMLANVQVQGATPPTPVALALDSLTHPGRFGSRLRANLESAKSSAGLVALLAFLAAMVSGAWRSWRDRSRAAELLPGAFALFYVAAVSGLTDLVPRYITVALPFALAQVGVELGHFSTRLGSTPRRISLATAGLVVIAALGYVATGEAPAPALAPRTAEPIAGIDAPQGGVLPNGAPLFALSPWEAYLLGGTYRTLPNDALERVAAYGRNTGVEYLAVSRSASNDALLYRNAPWYRAADLRARYPALLDVVYDSGHGAFTVYRLRPPPPAGGAQAAE
ncbi:MAG: glycosyltransferase family 39 protein [Deltaproteobacteria bacterium]|nr:glycosyltransferase family 39 protein [Deltaproteobacteria bacterium]